MPARTRGRLRNRSWRSPAICRALQGARIEGIRVGIRPMPLDEKPMVGWFPGLDGLYVVVSHSGVTLGPEWGKVAAAEILDSAPDSRLGSYRPARFL